MEAVATFLIIFEAYMNISLIVKLKIIMLIKLVMFGVSEYVQCGVENGYHIFNAHTIQS